MPGSAMTNGGTMLGFTRSILFRAFLLGVTAGMRSQTPGAVLAWYRDDAPRYARWRSWPVLRSVWGRRALLANGVGEMVLDKSPLVPPRTNLSPLFGRALFGALAGAAIGSERRGTTSILRGAIAGAVGGVAGSFGGQRARELVVNATGLPDPAVAVFEDAAAVTFGRHAVTKRA
jgi:uncharacterized membrane protein